MVVIVTRPASAGKRLFDRVIEQGHRALWWPAFDIDAAQDVERARAALTRLADYDLAIFVSVHAVRAVRPLSEGAWPSGTMTSTQAWVPPWPSRCPETYRTGSPTK